MFNRYNWKDVFFVMYPQSCILEIFEGALGGGSYFLTHVEQGFNNLQVQFFTVNDQ